MAGTVVLTSRSDQGVIHRAVITCTADVAAATYPATTLASLGLSPEGTLLALVTNPGATAPTDNYDITLIDGDGLDRLFGYGLNRDTANSELVRPNSPISKGETLTLTLANNSVNSAVVVITLLWSETLIDLPHWAYASDGSLAVTDGTGNAYLANVSGVTYPEDQGHITGDRGLFILAVRNDADAALTGTDLDYTPIATDSAGRVKIVEGAKSLPSTPTLTNVAASVTSVTLKAANTARQELLIFNDSTSLLYVKYGATASATSFTHYVPAYSLCVIDDYDGIVDGIWVSATGSARVTETTA